MWVLGFRVLGFRACLFWRGRGAAKEAYGQVAKFFWTCCRSQYDTLNPLATTKTPKVYKQNGFSDCCKGLGPVFYLLLRSMWSFPEIGGPKYRSPNPIVLNPFLLLIKPPLIINNKSGNPKMSHEHFKKGCTNFKRSKTIMN